MKRTETQPVGRRAPLAAPSMAPRRRVFAQPINDGRCCDRCHAERVIPERARRILERDANREGNGGALQ